jgi:hypothetical protein
MSTAAQNYKDAIAAVEQLQHEQAQFRPPPPHAPSPLEQAQQTLAQAKAQLRTHIIQRLHILQTEAAKRYFLLAQDTITAHATLTAITSLLPSPPTLRPLPTLPFPHDCGIPSPPTDPAFGPGRREDIYPSTPAAVQREALALRAQLQRELGEWPF